MATPRVAFAAGPSHGVMTGMNITPLVDVLLVLLVIFMVQSVPRDQGIDVGIARSATPDTALPPPRALLSISAEGLLRLDGVILPAADVRSELAGLRARDPRTLLALEASEQADYALFAQALAAARNVGFTDVALR